MNTKKMTLVKYCARIAVVDPSVDNGWKSAKTEPTLWINPEELPEKTVAEWLMSRYIQQGYVKDSRYYYPITSVLRIRFEKIDKREFVDDYNEILAYTDEMIQSLQPWEE